MKIFIVDLKVANRINKRCKERKLFQELTNGNENINWKDDDHQTKTSNQTNDQQKDQYQ